jgi:hypothetical protein
MRIYYTDELTGGDNYQTHTFNRSNDS